jgi:hypothetical protein
MQKMEILGHPFTVGEEIRIAGWMFDADLNMKRCRPGQETTLRVTSVDAGHSITAEHVREKKSAQTARKHSVQSAKQYGPTMRKKW